jgi:hypothetical protein
MDGGELNERRLTVVSNENKKKGSMLVLGI